ncbi:MAG: SusC/RagA family TonB-linked outer membrane protein [Bacteroidales bacterium]|jgi:TonB-linked SusC/RagA family outer membrane protein|nr:SusC/RagA family TonB-linked outer membrane protein [Bacteroidales bacterium]
MRKITTILIFILAGITVQSATAQTATVTTAQTATVTGTITDATTGEALTGASIRVKGTSYGTTSDVNGKYTIENIKQNAVLVFSFIGYQTLEQTCTGQEKLDVALKADVKMLDAVVAVGYGTTTKKEVTGSIASLKADDLNKGTFTHAAGLLQGKVAGLTVINPSGGDPNAQYEILLRGMNTLVAGQQPLIIIDGIAGADMRNINFQEVESIDVLKDGSAAAIYGTRGTNGVIIITTKRAREGVTQVEYEGQISVQTITGRAQNMTAEQFKYAIETYKPAAAGSLYGSETDWFDEVTRTPISHKHSLSISGGSKVFSHRTVLNVEQNQGLQKKNEAAKYLLKTNIHQSILGGWLDLDYNATVNIRRYTPANTDVFRQAFIHNPTEPVYDAANKKYGGYYTIEAMDYFNPVAMLNERIANSASDNLGFNGRATLNILPVEGLKWDNMLSYQQERYEARVYRTSFYPSIVGVDGEAEITNDYWNELQYESTLQYQRNFGDHALQAVAGYTFLQSTSQGSSMFNQGYDFDIWLTNNVGAGRALAEGHGGMSSYKESNRYIAFFGRVMYNYDERYLFSASIRRDGSSRFGDNHKWGWFPAVSAGWRIHREKFMRDVKWINDLKLRAGYGVTGNQDFGNYLSLLLMRAEGYVYNNGRWVNTYSPKTNPNPDLRWEKKSEWNVGVDFSFLDNRLSGTIDYYRRTTSDLLYWYDVTVPPYLVNELFANLGTLTNQGIEVMITGVPVKTKKVQWTSSLTLAHNKNKMIKFTDEKLQNANSDVGWLNTPMGVYCQRLIDGQSIGSFYAPTWVGVDANGEDILELISTGFSYAGSAYPDVTLGWSNTVEFYGFDFNIMLRASIGGKIFNRYRGDYENITSLGLQNILASWLDDPTFTGNPQYSSKYIEDATYMKIDNISLGYTFNINKRLIKNLRLYFAAQNILCVTNYKGIDPEVSLSGLSPGIESTSYYPRTAIFTFGTHVTF